MNRKKITISDEGAIAVPVGVRMTVCEIADVFGVYYQTVKRYIRDIEKSGIADGDYRMSCIADRTGVRPEYYGLEMIVALAFRFRSWQATQFRLGHRTIKRGGGGGDGYHERHGGTNPNHALGHASRRFNIQLIPIPRLPC